MWGVGQFRTLSVEVSRRRALQEVVAAAGTPRQVARRYGLSVDRIYALVERGDLPAYNAGFTRKRLILFSDFERWLKSTKTRRTPGSAREAG